MKSLITFGIVVLVAIIAYNLFTFTVDETRKAAVLRFGEIVRIVEEPGLYFKVPIVQRVTYLEDRVLNYDIQPRNVLTSDQKRLVIDNYAIWRVGDPQAFIESTGGQLRNAQSRIDDIVYSDLRNILAKNTLDEIVSEKRLEYLQQVAELSREKLQEFGIVRSTCGSNEPICRLRSSRPSSRGCGPSESASPRSCGRRARSKPDRSPLTPTRTRRSSSPTHERRRRRCAARAMPAPSRSTPRRTTRIRSSIGSGARSTRIGSHSPTTRGLS